MMWPFKTNQMAWVAYIAKKVVGPLVGTMGHYILFAIVANIIQEKFSGENVKVIFKFGFFVILFEKRSQKISLI